MSYEFSIQKSSLASNSKLRIQKLKIANGDQFKIQNSKFKTQK